MAKWYLTRVPRPFNKQWWKNWISPYKRMKLNPYLTPYVKVNSKCMEELNVRAETIKLYKGEKLHELVFDNDFLDMTPKAQATKEKNG